MNGDYKEMKRQSPKMSAMSDEQIEAALAMQEPAMQQTGADLSAVQQSVQKAFGGFSANDNGDDCFEFSENPSINTSYRWAVACGADLIQLRGDIINDLATGTDDEMCREILSEQWGVNTKADFTKMADNLKAGCHSSIYGRLADGEDIPDYENEKENLNEALTVFKEEGLLSAVPNMLIWDLGRLINISRFAFDARLIDRKTALSYIKDAALRVKENYSSWRELSLAYQFGCAVWGGLVDFDMLKDGMAQLLTEKNSPWITLPFDMTLDFEEEN